MKKTIFQLWGGQLFSMPALYLLIFGLGLHEQALAQVDCPNNLEEAIQSPTGNIEHPVWLQKSSINRYDCLDKYTYRLGKTGIGTNYIPKRTLSLSAIYSPERRNFLNCERPALRLHSIAGSWRTSCVDENNPELQPMIGDFPPYKDFSWDLISDWYEPGEGMFISHQDYEQNNTNVMSLYKEVAGMYTLNPQSSWSVSGNSSIGKGYAVIPAPTNGLIVEGFTGLGTSSPVNYLDVSGGAVIGTGNAGSNSAPTDGLLVQGKVGLGLTNPQSALDVNGGVAIGSPYAGGTVAPANGMIVKGNVGINVANPTEQLQMADGTFRMDDVDVYHENNAPSSNLYSHGYTLIMTNYAETKGFIASVISDGSVGSNAFGTMSDASGGQYFNVGVETRASGTLSTGQAAIVRALDARIAPNITGPAANVISDGSIAVFAQIGVSGSTQHNPRPSNTIAVFGRGQQDGNGGTNNWASYFEGECFTTNTWSSSDRKLKKSIVEIPNALENIKKIKSYSYNFNTEKYPHLVLPNELQYGFIANEVAEVFPNLTKKVISPGNYNEKTKQLENKEEFTALNYTGFIPILLKGIQEQQEIIEALKKEVESLKVSSSFSINNAAIREQSGKLFQNTPNPFNSTTKIKFELPEKFNEAQLLIFDLNGTQKLSFKDLKPEQTEIILSAGNLSSGMYLYTLLIDGKEIDTKRMILTK